MKDVNTLVFIALFKEVCEKCFGHTLQQPLSETESKLLYNQVLEKTGLVIGWKSLKNYSGYVLDQSQGKEENPSTASLDTLARYVLNAPYISETERKNKEGHYPYWFQYKEQWHKNKKPVTAAGKLPYKALISVSVVLVVILPVLFFILKPKDQEAFTDNFHTTEDDSLSAHGWFLQSKDAAYWNRRNENAHMLSLFTLRGDNWHDSVNRPVIKNLLLREIPSGCFTAEVHLKDFFPEKEWQQAGILLLEDTVFKGRSLRLSLAYNDFFGGFSRPKEIIIQAITSQGNGLSRPEEIAHVPVFTIDSANKSLVKNNLQFTGLRIEKTGNRFRLLYSCSPTDNFAFKEAVTNEFAMQPKYIGIFALKGFVNDTTVIPSTFSYFTIAPEDCRK